MSADLRRSGRPRPEGAARPPPPLRLVAFTPVGSPMASPPCPPPSCLPRSPSPCKRPCQGFDHLGLTSHARLPCLSLAYPTATHPPVLWPWPFPVQSLTALRRPSAQKLLMAPSAPPPGVLQSIASETSPLLPSQLPQTLKIVSLELDPRRCPSFSSLHWWLHPAP